MEPGPESLPRPDWEPEPRQRPVMQPEPGPEKTPTTLPGSRTLQGLQQETTAQPEDEAHKEPKVQQKSVLHQKFFAPFPSLPPPSTPNRKPHLNQQETTSQPTPELEKVTAAQQESELKEGRVPLSGSGLPKPCLAPQEAAPAQAIPGSKEGRPAHIECPSQERLEQSGSRTQQTSSVQGAKSKQGSLTEWGFLTRLHELSVQRSAQEWKSFFDWVTESDTEADLSSTSETKPSARMSGTAAPGVKPTFKKKSNYEAMSGYSGTSSHGKKTSIQNHKHYRDTGESEP